jgi:hypothetical protein
MRASMILAVAVLALAACNQKPAEPKTGADTVNLPAAVAPASTSAPTPPQQPGAGGFTHDKGADLFGYFLPASEVKVGSWKLTALSVGSEDEFAKWEAGQRTATYSPVMFEFEDVTSPLKANELGQQVHTRSVRVLASAYAISGAKLAFSGQDPAVGPVAFSGVIDLAALKASKAAGPNGGPATIVKGDLKIGAASFNGLAFTWFGGD